MKKLLNGTGGERVRFQYENDFGHSKEALVPFEGVVHNLERRYRETGSDGIREHIGQYMSAKPCARCKGQRLREGEPGCNGRRPKYFVCDVACRIGERSFF